MNLFYQPKVGHHVRIKNTQMTGIVIKGGIYPIVQLDSDLGCLRVNYARLEPVDSGLILRQKIQKIWKTITQKLPF